MYREAFAKLTPDKLDQLCAMVSDQVYFSDPFNQIIGKTANKDFIRGDRLSTKDLDL